MSSSSRYRAALTLTCGTLCFAWTLAARAQSDPYGPQMAPFGAGQPPAQRGASGSPSAPPDGAPQTHAAPGSGESLLPPSSEPTLPDEPLELDDSVADRVGSDLVVEDLPRGESSDSEQRFWGPYYERRSGAYRFRTLFPLWVDRQQPSASDPSVVDRASVYGGLYYNRRSAEHSDDVLFPLFWNLRNPLENSRTTVVGPLVNRRTPDESDDWLAPLYFTGKRPGGGYTLLPPLLTYTSRDAEGGFNLIGPGFCSWKGRGGCDTRSATEIDFGIAPLYFFGQDAVSQYEAIPPLLHYYSYDDRDQSWLDIWGPYYREHREKLEILHVLPFYWSLWGKDERHTTVLPFFHHGYKGNSWLHVNPLFLMGRGENDESTFVTWGYARYRGRTELDMISPLYWHYRDPDAGVDQKLLLPFLYSRTSPRETSQVFFPFWAHFERYGVSETTWITPLFRHSHDLRGWSTSINPLLYVGRDGNQSWTVVPPLFWDIAGKESRTTVGFPLYWRFSDRNEVTQLVGNVFYNERKVTGGLDWQIHIFPAFSYGETPDGHWWNVLYGLAGYTRKGSRTTMRTLWIPIDLSGSGSD